MSSCVWANIDALRLAIANSAKWQAWTKTSDATAAAARIHVQGVCFSDNGEPIILRDEIEQQRPICLIGKAPNVVAFHKQAVRSIYPQSIRLTVGFEDSIDPDLRHEFEASERAFDSNHEVVMQEAFDLCGEYPYPDVDTCIQEVSAVRTHPDDEENVGDAYACRWAVIIDNRT